MPKSEVNEITEKTIKKGGILAKLYFDMQSEKKEDLQPLMTDLANNRLLKSPGVIYCFGAINEPISLGDRYSTSAELTVLVKNLGALIAIAFNFAPAGVEVLEPKGRYELTTSELQSILIDLSQTSLEYSSYILSRVMKKEDYEKIKEEIKGREELGKRYMKKEEQ